MRKRTSKTTSDPNVAAFRGMQALLEKIDPESLPKPKQPKPKGSAGGKARAKKLPAKRRKAIASKAAKKRWGYEDS